MGSPKTVDRNAMTFVSIGWSVGFCGVKMRVELAGPSESIHKDEGSRIGLTNQTRASVTKFRKQSQKGQGQLNQEPCKRTAEEADNETMKQMAELQEKYPGCVHSRRRGSACDSLQGDGTLGL